MAMSAGAIRPQTRDEIIDRWCRGGAVRAALEEYRKRIEAMEAARGTSYMERRP